MALGLRSAESTLQRAFSIFASSSVSARSSARRCLGPTFVKRASLCAAAGTRATAERFAGFAGIRDGFVFFGVDEVVRKIDTSFVLTALPLDAFIGLGGALWDGV